jgi:hypothetical protein
MRTGAIILAIFIILHCPSVRAQEKGERVRGDMQTVTNQGFYTDFNYRDLEPIVIGKGDFSLEIGGHIALDAVKYGYANKRRSGLEFDDATLIISGQFKSLSWRIEPDLLGRNTPGNIYDAWGSLAICQELRLTAGQFRVALGSEYATRKENLPFAGYGFTSYLDGRYDVGFRIDGDLLKRMLWYEATATLGEGFDPEGNRLESPLYALRLVGHPFGWIKDTAGFWRSLQGFFAGVSIAHTTDFDDPIMLATPFESRVFKTRDLEGDSGQWMHYEFGYHRGPFRLAYEHVSGSADDVPTARGGKEDMDQLTAFVVYASWNITGEEQVWRSGGWVKPAKASSGRNGFFDFLPGRWELGVRYSNADIDRDLFTYGYTYYGQSTQEVRTFSLNLNWQPRDQVRLSAGWVKTIADQDLATFGDTDRDSSFILRFELVI